MGLCRSNCGVDFFYRHVVSNVGRVAARDSSRAIANGQDLFIALCEDSSVYGLFKNMAGECRRRRRRAVNPSLD